MGMLDNFKKIFNKGSEEIQEMEPEDPYKKSMLASQIVDLVHGIQRINSFDSSVWNLSNVSSRELERRSQDELERLHDSLSKRLSELAEEKQRRGSNVSSLEESKWTGRKPQSMSDKDFDRLQRDEGRY